jgi:hypothetical protein
MLSPDRRRECVAVKVNCILLSKVLFFNVKSNMCVCVCMYIYSYHSVFKGLIHLVNPSPSPLMDSVNHEILGRVILSCKIPVRMLWVAFFQITDALIWTTESTSLAARESF